MYHLSVSLIRLFPQFSGDSAVRYPLLLLRSINIMAIPLRPSIKFSFGSMDPRRPRTAVIIDVVLKHKRGFILRNRRGNVVGFYKTNSDSYASFECRPELSYSELRAQVGAWMPGLSPSLCAQLSRGIFVYAQQVVAANRATLFVEIDEPKLQPTDDDVYTGLWVDIADDGGILMYDDDDDEEEEDDESSKPPRGLSWDEINGLKQESWFKSSCAEEKESLICSICLEEFSPGVKITPLLCSHTFHHNCIATWLHKQPSCPLCRFHIRQLCS